MNDRQITALFIQQQNPSGKENMVNIWPQIDQETKQKILEAFRQTLANDDQLCYQCAGWFYYGSDEHRYCNERLIKNEKE